MTKQEHENRCKELLKRVPADKLRLNGLNHLDSEYIQSLEQRNEELEGALDKAIQQLVAEQGLCPPGEDENNCGGICNICNCCWYDWLKQPEPPEEAKS
jgi:hypothetical protein